MHPMTSKRVALCAALTLAMPSIWALPSHYHLTDLGPDSMAESVSPAGRIAGVDGRHGRTVAAIWNDDERHDRQSPDATGDAHGVNDAGDAVGEIGDLNLTHAAVWHGKNVVDLGAMLGGGFLLSRAMAINGQGDCVMDAETRDEANSYIVPGCADTRALVKISPPAGDSGTSTAAINDRGDVAGTVGAPELAHAFLYTGGAAQDLGMLDGDNASAAHGLNDAGHVVGTSANYPFLFRGFFFDGQAMHAMGSFGGAHTFANAINRDDVAVGSADFDSVGETFHAFVVDAAHHPGTLHDLNTMLDQSGTGWSVEDAVGIDDAGRIVVRGFKPGTTGVRSALLTPAD
jgi:uncharacterized membrane protein